MKTIQELEYLKPCADGLIWAKQQSSLAEAWNRCERSDWMWWLLRKLNKCPKELSIKYSRWCVDSIEQLKSNAAANAISAAAYTANVIYAAAAANAATYAAAAADAADATYAATYAADAATNAYAATYAADAAAYAAKDTYANIATVAANAYAAYVAAKKEQANYLRSIVTNPFES